MNDMDQMNLLGLMSFNQIGALLEAILPVDNHLFVCRSPTPTANSNLPYDNTEST